MKTLRLGLIGALALLLAAAASDPGPGVATPTGTLQGAATFVWNGSAWVAQPGGAGGSTVSTSPAIRTLVPLDVATVTTGGTAVNALSAAHRSAGGWLQNPPNATINLCINEIGTASGTTSAGSTTCIAPGQTYLLAPTAGAVSVISSDSSHPFSGMGWQ
jgi:hypothetical protein